MSSTWPAVRSWRKRNGLTLLLVLVGMINLVRTDAHAASNRGSSSRDIGTPMRMTWRAHSDKAKLPHDAAAHFRAENPSPEVHTVVQHILNDLKAGNRKSSGPLKFVSDTHDVVMDFTFHLDQRMTVIDDLDVSHFEGISGDTFVFRAPTATTPEVEGTAAAAAVPDVQPGAILVGSHDGHWAGTPRSRYAIHQSDKGDHASGDLAYLRRVVRLEDLGNGLRRVHTAGDVQQEALMAKGSLGLFWNHTKPTLRRRSEREFGEILEEVEAARDRRALGTRRSSPSDGIQTQQQQQQQQQQRPTLRGDAEAPRRVLYNYGQCDEIKEECYQDPMMSVYQDMLLSDDNNELCAFCFEYVKTLDLFSFNYDPQSGWADEETLYPIPGVSTIYCTDCFAYLGASAAVVVDWDYMTYMDEIAAFVEGSAKFNFDFMATSTSSTFNTMTEVGRVNECVGPIYIGDFLTISANCVLSLGVAGSLSFQGHVHATSMLDASRKIGIRYDGTSWYDLSSSTWDYEPPSLDIEVEEGGSFDIDLIAKPALEVEVNVGFSLLTLTTTAEIALEPSVNLLAPREDDTGADSRRRLSNEHDSGVAAGKSNDAVRYIQSTSTTEASTADEEGLRFQGRAADGIYAFRPGRSIPILLHSGNTDATASSSDPAAASASGSGHDSEEATPISIEVGDSPSLELMFMLQGKCWDHMRLALAHEFVQPRAQQRDIQASASALASTDTGADAGGTRGVLGTRLDIWVPWHSLIEGNVCDEYSLQVFEARKKEALATLPVVLDPRFADQGYFFETVAVDGAQAGETGIVLSNNLTIHWPAEMLSWYHEDPKLPAHLGYRKDTEQVVVDLVQVYDSQPEAEAGAGRETGLDSDHGACPGTVRPGVFGEASTCAMHTRLAMPSSSRSGHTTTTDATATAGDSAAGASLTSILPNTGHATFDLSGGLEQFYPKGLNLTTPSGAYLYSYLRVSSMDSSFFSVRSEPLALSEEAFVHRHRHEEERAKVGAQQQASSGQAAATTSAFDSTSPAYARTLGTHQDHQRTGQRSLQRRRRRLAAGAAGGSTGTLKTGYGADAHMGFRGVSIAGDEGNIPLWTNNGDLMTMDLYSAPTETSDLVFVSVSNPTSDDGDSSAADSSEGSDGDGGFFTVFPLAAFIPVVVVVVAAAGAAVWYLVRKQIQSQQKAAGDPKLDGDAQQTQDKKKTSGDPADAVPPACVGRSKPPRGPRAQTAVLKPEGFVYVN